jgi:hypothetical protein
MIITFRPELQNPPMDPECTIGFSFIGKNGGETTYYNLSSGVTRDFPEEVWEKIKEQDVVKQLLAWGALKVVEEAEAPVEERKVRKSRKTTLADLSLDEAMSLIEASFDRVQLESWAASDDRIPVKNAVAGRLVAVAGGKG